MNKNNNNHLTSTAGSITSVKVHLNDEARRFPFPLTADADQFAVFVNLIRDSFARTLTDAPFKLTYVDDENDRVTIGSHVELMAAVGVASRMQSILRITVVPHETMSGALPITASSTITNAETPSTVTPTLDASESSAQPSISDAPRRRGLGHRGGGRCGFGHGGPSHGHGHGHWHHKFEHLRSVFSSQLAALEEQGISEAPVNIRLLRKFNGDIDAVVNHLRNANTNANTNANANANTKGNAHHAQESEFESKYAAELQRLQATGAPRMMCMRVLRRFNGDVESAEAKIQQRIGKFGGGNPFVRDVEFENNHAADIEHLHTNTGSPRWACIRMLRRFDGDVEKATEKLTKKRAKLEKHHNGECEARSAMTEHEFESTYATALQQLESNTGAPAAVCVRVLRKFNGDVARAEARINIRRAKFGGANPFERDVDFEAQHAAEIERLQESTGIPRFACANVLRRLGGDAEKATVEINNKKAKFEKRHPEQTAKFAAKQARKAEIQARKAENQARKTEIQARKDENQARKAENQARKIQNQARKDEIQARKAENQARKNENQARKTEKSSGAAVAAADSSRFADERQQLVDMGFERVGRINRLLEKHNGDIGNVVEDLLA